MHATLALTNLSYYHSQTHTEWHSVAAAVAMFDWPTALHHVFKAVDYANLFFERASELAELTELTECVNITPTGIPYPVCPCLTNY
jgi:hypothetical protein